MDSSDGHYLWSAVFALLLAADFLLAALGAALQSVTDTMLDNAVREGRAGAEKVRELEDNPQRLIRACWFYSILTAYPAACLCAGLGGWKRCLAGLLCGVFVYLFGKSIPRLVGRKYSMGFGLRVYGIAGALIALSLPFTALLSGITGGLVRLIGIHPKELEDEVTEDEIMNMVNEGHEQGVLDEHEAEMIQNIFQLGDTEAQDIMTHRKNICAIDGATNLSDAISFMVSASNSRFPVYEENIDNILGVLHLKDAVIFHNKGEYDSWLIKDIPELIRPVSFIPETRSIDELFRSMQAKKMQMVIVVDEYGETAGLVTMEDILEEIVGNILDEYDEDDHFILPDGKDAYLMAGMTPLEEVEQTLQVEFDSEDYDTLNGYLVFLLDRIPDPQDHSVITKSGWKFTIMEVDSRMIKWVRVTRCPQEADKTRQETAAGEASRG